MLLIQRYLVMGANGQLGKLLGSFIDSQTGKGYQVIGHLEGMTIVTRTEPTSVSAPVISRNNIILGVVRYQQRDQIKYISFYDKKTGVIKKSIDFVYDNEGKIVASQYKMIRGERRFVGTHWHKWPLNTGSKKGRVTHDESNRFPISSNELRWINKAIRYNQSH